jgi:hypothetical protein
MSLPVRASICVEKNMSFTNLNLVEVSPDLLVDPLRGMAMCRIFFSIDMDVRDNKKPETFLQIILLCFFVKKKSYYNPVKFRYL